jgi:murein L,D-transpeptidase YcbB/YkuD
VDADFWLRQWAAFVNAPVPCLIFLALGLAGAWWFRGSVDQGETRGLRAQIEGLKEQINAWEQRLKLASEQEQAAIKATQSAKDEIATLTEQMANRVSVVTMATTTASIEGHLVEARRAQEQVSGTLDFTRGQSVSDLQSRLRDLGFYVGNIDGLVGPGTQAAIQKFQQANGLKADGLIGPATAARLLPLSEAPKER